MFGGQRQWYSPDMMRKNKANSINELRCKKDLRGFLRSDTDWSEQSLKKVRSLNFWIKEEEGLYYLCSENKDVRHFRIGKNPVFSRCGTSLRNNLAMRFTNVACTTILHSTSKILAIFYALTSCTHTAYFAWELMLNPLTQILS